MEALVDWIVSNCPDAKIEGFWSKAGGSSVAKMEVVAENGDDRVLVAGRKLKKGCRLPVPPACILTEDKVRETSLSKALEGVDVYTLFAMFLIHERRKQDKSFWKPYIDVLPTEIGFHPITFMERAPKEPELQNELSKEGLLLRALQAQNEKLVNEYQKTIELLAKACKSKGKKFQEIKHQYADNPPSQKEFLWANCMVITRAFKMDDPQIMCMLPFADSMNHDSKSPTVQWRPKLPKGYFIVSLLSDVEEGSELKANYHGSLPSGSETARQKELGQVSQYAMYGFVEDPSLFKDLRAMPMKSFNINVQ